MLAEVERGVSQQSGGKQAQLSQLELAQARLQVLGSLIQREVLFQRGRKREGVAHGGSNHGDHQPAKAAKRYD